MQNLVVTTPAFLTLLCVLTALVGVLAALRWRSRRWLSGVVVTVVTLGLGVTAAADFVNAHYQYVPQVRDVADLAVPGLAYPQIGAAVAAHPFAHPRQPGGVVRISMPNGRDGLGKSRALVYLPSAYFAYPSIPLPVVYLIHGSPGSPEDWFRAGHAAAVGAKLDRIGTPAVLVAPSMSSGWTDDSECVNGRRERVEHHLLAVVIPTVQRRFHVRTDRGARIIAGNSAGGYCALNLALRHRDLFGTVDDLSGSTKPTFRGGMAKLFGTTLTAPQLARTVQANTPAAYVPLLANGPRMRIWLDSGRSDRQVLAQETALSIAFRARTDVEIRLCTRPGGHTYAVWRPALLASLEWALSGVPKQPPAR